MPRRQRAESGELLKYLTLKDVLKRFRDTETRSTATCLEEDIAYALFDLTRNDPTSRTTAHQLWQYAENLVKRLDGNYLVISRRIGGTYYGKERTKDRT